MEVRKKRVVELREERRWSQDELAIAAGLSLRTVQRIENDGVAALRSVKALAAAFDVDCAELDGDQETSGSRSDFREVVSTDRRNMIPLTSIVDDPEACALRLGTGWTLEGDVLVGDSGSRPGEPATFGAQDWLDYELDLFLTIERGANASHFIRRALDGKSFYACNTLCALKVFRVALVDNHRAEAFSDLSLVDFDFVHDREYHLRICARGASITTYVDGTLVNQTTDSTLRRGHAAFGLWKNRVRIRRPAYRLLRRSGPAELEA